MELNEENKRRLESKLQVLALTDWEEFKRVVSLDLTQIFICQEKQKGLSYRQISEKLNTGKEGRSTVRYRSNKCAKF